jgi:hypothetical protein
MRFNYSMHVKVLSRRLSIFLQNRTLHQRHGRRGQNAVRSERGLTPAIFLFIRNAFKQ